MLEALSVYRIARLGWAVRCNESMIFFHVLVRFAVGVRNITIVTSVQDAVFSLFLTTGSVDIAPKVRVISCLRFLGHDSHSLIDDIIPSVHCSIHFSGKLAMLMSAS